MPKPETGDKPEKGKARKAIGEIAVRAFTVLVANELADAVRETITWLTN
ncbi:MULTISPECIES: hypothetical protein [Corynebacterium]|nr:MULTISPECIES: hypothetical protein [Corynebacterium]MCQ9167459.1 hypothetical protein [Corynebacterium amycolatum]MCQ9173708.1 hypothetical protein [Corynebacterium amycolatum]